jgi:hypothetical protein
MESHVNYFVLISKSLQASHAGIIENNSYEELSYSVLQEPSSLFMNFRGE